MSSVASAAGPPLFYGIIPNANEIVPQSASQATFGGTYPFSFPSGIVNTNIVGPVFNVTNPAYGSPSSGNYATVIANAVAVAAAAGGGTVYFPCYGSYGIGSPGVTLTSADANVILEGCGTSSIIQPLSTLTGPAINAYETNDVTFRNFECQGTSSTATSNVAQPCFQSTGSEVVRYENLNGFYLGAPLIKMIGVNSSNYSFVQIATNIQCQQSVGCIYGDNSASDVGQAAQSLTFMGTNIGANNQIGSTEAFYFKDSHDVFLTNAYSSWGFGSLTGSGIGMHIVGDTGPVMVTGFDAQAGTGSTIMQTDVNTSGDLTPPARIMVSNSIFELSSGGVALNAGTQIGFTNDTFEYITGTTTYPCALCIASGVTDVRFLDNTTNNNGGGSVSPFYTIKNASTGAVIVSHNTFNDNGTAGLVSNGSGNSMMFRDNEITTSNNISSNTKPYSIANNIDLVANTPQDWALDSSGDTTQTGYLTVANNFFSSAPPPNNVSATLLGWNGGGFGEATIADRYYNSNTGQPVFSIYAPSSSAGTAYSVTSQLMRNGGYYDPVLNRYAVELTNGVSAPTHPQEIIATVAYSASPTTITFPGSFAFASTSYNCVIEQNGTTPSQTSYVIASATSLTFYSSVTSGNMTYDCKGS